MLYCVVSDTGEVNEVFLFIKWMKNEYETIKKNFYNKYCWFYLHWIELKRVKLLLYVKQSKLKFSWNIVKKQQHSSWNSTLHRSKNDSWIHVLIILIRMFLFLLRINGCAQYTFESNPWTVNHVYNQKEKSTTITGNKSGLFCAVILIPHSIVLYLFGCCTLYR